MKLKQHPIIFSLFFSTSIGMMPKNVSNIFIQKQFFQDTEHKETNYEDVLFKEKVKQKFNDLINVLKEKKIESLFNFINIDFEEEQTSIIFKQIITTDWQLEDLSKSNRFIFFYFLSNFLKKESHGDCFKYCKDEDLIDFFKKYNFHDIIDFLYRTLNYLKEKKSHVGAELQIQEMVLVRSYGTKGGGIE